MVALETSTSFGISSICNRFLRRSRLVEELQVGDPAGQIVQNGWAKVKARAMKLCCMSSWLATVRVGRGYQ